ncbi:MAG: lipoprotein [Spirochaetota bacterium]
MKAIAKLSLLICCILLCQCSSEELVRGARKKRQPVGQIAMGHIENREAWMTGFATSNFRDMLKFEFMHSGYDIMDMELVDAENQPKKPRENPPPPPPPDKKPETSLFEEESPEYNIEDDEIGRTKSHTEKLLPKEKKAIVRKNNAPAGEEQGKQAQRYFDIGGENLQALQKRQYQRQISPGEIKALAKKHTFKYYIQGSFSIQENNEFIDSKKSSFVFLHVFGRKGDVVGMISFAIENNSLYEADEMKQACQEIVKKFTNKLNR